MYLVFRRNDGYVGAVKRSTLVLGRQALAGWQTPKGFISFEILLETEDWDEAWRLIDEERAK